MARMKRMATQRGDMSRQTRAKSKNLRNVPKKMGQQNKQPPQTRKKGY